MVKGVYDNSKRFIPSRKGISQNKGKLNGQWKGSKVGLSCLHKWVNRNFGRPRICEFCKSETKKLYDWSNKKHTYKRIREDWQRLCRSCHFKYDYMMGFRKKGYEYFKRNRKKSD